MMNIDQFTAAVDEALAAIPERIRKNMSNVALVIEDQPRPARPGEFGINGRGVLLGLYQGVPLTRRGSNYTFVLPDKITLFQHTIEAIAGPDEQAVKKLIKETVWHEVAHHLGMNENQVRKWEQAGRKHS